MSHICQMLPKTVAVKSKKYTKGGRFFASENDMQHKCNNILKKYK